MRVSDFGAVTKDTRNGWDDELRGFVTGSSYSEAGPLAIPSRHLELRVHFQHGNVGIYAVKHAAPDGPQRSDVLDAWLHGEGRLPSDLQTEEFIRRHESKGTAPKILAYTSSS